MSFQNIVTDLQSQTNQVNYERGLQNLGNDQLDKHAFFQLMMTKLQNQDPLNPTDDDEFLAQQAQLAQVEKLDNLLSILEGNSLLSQASTLVGKQVDVQANDGSIVTGTVDSASFGADGETGISINDQTYSMAQVVKIYASAPSTDSDSGTGSS